MDRIVEVAPDFVAVTSAHASSCSSRTESGSSTAINSTEIGVVGPDNHCRPLRLHIDRFAPGGRDLGAGRNTRQVRRGLRDSLRRKNYGVVGRRKHRRIDEQGSEIDLVRGSLSLRCPTRILTAWLRRTTLPRDTALLGRLWRAGNVGAASGQRDHGRTCQGGHERVVTQYESALHE